MFTSFSDITPRMLIIVVVGVFMGSFMDAIAGGGGIITVTTYLLSGLPAHIALGTNKLSSSIGTTVSTYRYIRSGYVNWKLGIPSIILALTGSHLGTRFQLMVDERYLQYLLLIVLPIVSFIVLRQRTLPEEPGLIQPSVQMSIVCVSAFFIGMYDGFYGPGTGTFLLLVFCNLAKMDVRTASGNVKLVNVSSNYGAMMTSLINGKVFLALGLIGAVSAIAGHYIGSGVAIQKGSKIIRPMIVIVLLLLAIKILYSLFI